MAAPTGTLDDLSSEHYAAIGRVAVEWAIFESNIDLSAIRLAKINHEAGICFTAQITGSGRKLDAYIAIAQWRGATKKTMGKLHELAKDSTGLAERRNKIVHDSLGGQQKTTSTRGHRT